LQLAADATDKFWTKLRRKIEAEYLDDAHQCQWKLGVAHEGFFPGRRRVVLRPRFDVAADAGMGGARTRSGDGQDSPAAGPSPRTGGRLSLGASVDDLDGGLVDIDDVASPEASERLKLALARSLAGHILDVTSKEAVDAAADGHDLSADLAGAAAAPHKAAAPAGTNKGPASASATAAAAASVAVAAAAAPGTGWGLVDADGSEEGFGVVGLEPTMVDLLDNDRFGDFDAPPPPPARHGADSGADGSHAVPNAPGAIKAPTDARAAPSAAAAAAGGVGAAGDHMGDVRLVEDALREGRGAVETGPQFSGTKKLGGGGVIQKCRVIMVTASGNFWGTLSFNAREIFFASSLEPEDGHKEDSAAVNLVPQVD
jgi:hypothetical protein